MSKISPIDIESNGKITPIETEPTLEELVTLERISDLIPLTAWLIVFCEMCEGFSSMGTYQIMQNYIQFPEPTSNSSQPGALDRGQQTATALVVSYNVFCYLTPIPGAIIADQYWGRYKTIVISCLIYLVGLILLVVTSIPISIKSGAALPGLICSIIIIGVGIGGFKSVSGSFMAEQYTRTKPVIKEIKGRKKIIDPEITVQSLFNWLCWAYGLGSFASTLITTSVEKYHSFWLAYLIPLCIFPWSIVVLLIGRRRYIRTPTTRSLVLRGFRTILTCLRNRWKFGKKPSYKHWLDYAKEEASANQSNTTTEQPINQFVDDLKKTLSACRIFLFFPIYWLCYNQVSGNLTSQAAQMNVGPIPNDVLGSIVPLIVVIFAPFFDKVVYPLLRRWNIKFGPIRRIACGFFSAALGMGYTAIVQHLIYSTEPNFDYETSPCSSCQTFNNINIAWQLPSYVFLAMSDMFAYISGLEYAFTNAPATMKSIVMSLYLGTAAIGGALNMVLIPVNVDPKLLWMYASIAIVTFVFALIFVVIFRNELKQTLPESVSMRRASIMSRRGYL